MKRILLFLVQLLICTSLFSQYKFLSNKWAWNNGENEKWTIKHEKTLIDLNGLDIHFTPKESYPFSLTIDKEVSQNKDYIEYRCYRDNKVWHIQFYQNFIVVLNYFTEYKMIFYLEF